MTLRILIGGIGNIFLGDDAFGVEVLRRLAERPLPEEVRAIDFGIRGLDLAYALLDGYDHAILVDAVPRGGEPGTLYLIEPDLGTADLADAPVALEMHNMDPVRVLRYVEKLGGKLGELTVVGCEPTAIADDRTDGLSPPVAAAVDRAVELIESLVHKILQGKAKAIAE